MNLDDNSKIIYEGGSGFLHKGLKNHTFLELLQDKIKDGTLSKLNNFKNIIICGGYNDKEESYTYSQLYNAIKTFIIYCKENFINANIFIGSIGYTNVISDKANKYRENINMKVTRAYNAFTDSFILENINEIMKNNNFFSSDGIHPNQSRTRSYSCRDL